MGLEISRNVRKRRVKADDSQMAWLKKKNSCHSLIKETQV